MIGTDNKTLVKKLSIIGMFFFILLLLTITAVVSYDYIQERQIEQKILQIKIQRQKIRDMILFCDFAKITDQEQATIDKCGDDVDAVKFVLLSCINTRIYFWNSLGDDLVTKLKQLIKYKADHKYNWNETTEIAYREAAKEFLKQIDLVVNQIDNWTRKAKALKDGTFNRATPLIDEEKGTRKNKEPNV